MFKLIVQGVGEASGVLRRAIAPRTVSEILKSKKLSGYFISRGCMIGFITDIISAPEKAKVEFKEGEVAFSPPDRSLWIALEDCRSNRPLTPIGKILKGLEVLEMASGKATTLEVLEG